MTMAVSMKKVALLLLVVAIVVAVLVEDAEGRRGGGGSRGGGRTRGRGFGRTRTRTRTRTRSSTRSVRNYSNYRLTGRSLGSSSYTAFNWKTAAMAGIIFGGMRYTQRFPNRYRSKRPPICTNNYENRPGENKRIGNFLCPMFNQTDELIYCCGPEHREFCCNKTTAQNFYGSRANKDSGSLGAGAVIGIIFVVIIVIVVIAVCCKKSGTTGSVIRKFSSRGKHQEHEAVPMHDPSLGTFHDQQCPPPQPAPGPVPAPMPQPPPYSPYENSNPGHNAGGPIPYGNPPMPQPGMGYQEKPPLDGGSYPPAPPPNASYPPPAGGPYPPPGGAYYPPPTDGAPYPPPSGAPYPPPSGAPYPPPGEVGVAYPPGGAVYPPPTGPGPAPNVAAPPYPAGPFHSAA